MFYLIYIPVCIISIFFTLCFINYIKMLSIITKLAFEFNKLNKKECKKLSIKDKLNLFFFSGMILENYIGYSDEKETAKFFYNNFQTYVDKLIVEYTKRTTTETKF